MGLFRPSPYLARAFIHAYWLMTWTALFGLILRKIKTWIVRWVEAGIFLQSTVCTGFILV